MEESKIKRAVERIKEKAKNTKKQKSLVEIFKESNHMNWTDFLDDYFKDVEPNESNKKR